MRDLQQHHVVARGEFETDFGMFTGSVHPTDDQHLTSSN
jgi:hypothetical protein